MSYHDGCCPETIHCSHAGEEWCHLCEVGGPHPCPIQGYRRFELPANRPIGTVEGERIRDGALAFAEILRQNLPDEALQVVYILLRATTAGAYDQIPLVEDRGHGQ